MSRIRGSGNKETELELAKLFRKNGVSGWRRKQKVLGKPDFVFHHKRLTVFVDGCFWHYCPEHRTKPKTNRAFWKRKLEANMLRDTFVTKELRKEGWRVIRIWEHDLTKRPDYCMKRIKQALSSSA